jgi:hypothetical protein
MRLYGGERGEGTVVGPDCHHPEPKFGLLVSQQLQDPGLLAAQHIPLPEIKKNSYMKESEKKD